MDIVSSYARKEDKVTKLSEVEKMMMQLWDSQGMMMERKACPGQRGQDRNGSSYGKASEPFGIALNLTVVPVSPMLAREICSVT